LAAIAFVRLRSAVGGTTKLAVAELSPGTGSSVAAVTVAVFVSVVSVTVTVAVTVTLTIPFAVRLPRSQ
jgi:hypothetical protein